MSGIYGLQASGGGTFSLISRRTAEDAALMDELYRPVSCPYCRMTYPISMPHWLPGDTNLCLGPRLLRRAVRGLIAT
jgi:hypothetical protein